ncbi:hypothetical protein N7486_010991 [Penicillium sp. IBT 16267x]|nr:hypothetical protein N7486_010991 [Penicillium sp. IBT 16267x]
MLLSPIVPSTSHINAPDFNSERTTLLRPFIDTELEVESRGAIEAKREDYHFACLIEEAPIEENGRLWRDGDNLAARGVREQVVPEKTRLPLKLEKHCIYAE